MQGSGGRKGEGDRRVKTGAFSGQTVRTVSEKAKEKLRETKEGQNFVVIAGGFNDVLRGKGARIGKQITKEVKDLRAMSLNVQIAVCTVPAVQGKGGHMERAMVAANK